LHLLEDNHRQRGAAGRLRLSLISFGRRLDGQERLARLERALAAYRASRAEHLVITGDLTEDGRSGQFEALAAVLLESRIDPHEVTLVPGNHDAYQDRSAFSEALRGPLRRFCPTSGALAVTVLDDVAIVPVSTAMLQPITRSAGEIADDQLERVQAVTSALKRSGRAIAVAQHHQPYGYSVTALNWLDGLQNHVSAMGLLQRHRELHVLHGHRHCSIDRQVESGEPARVFGTTACVDHASPLRLYETCDGRLWPVEPPEPALRPVPTLCIPRLSPAT
jgi:3',5'-cyclic AMP phosphodiesterase CpdA